MKGFMKKKKKEEVDGGGTVVKPRAKELSLNKLPAKVKRFNKVALKKDDNIVVLYLHSNGGMDFKLCRIIGGNIVVVNNKVHIIAPKDLWRAKKYSWYILREIDRRPVTKAVVGAGEFDPVNNDDYDDVKAAKMDTDADTPLIKAVLGAVQKNKGANVEKKWIVLVVVGIVVVGILFWLFGGGGGA